MTKDSLAITVVSIINWVTNICADNLIEYKKTKKDVSTKVLFFPDTDEENRRIFGSLALHLLSAKRSIDVCVYLITSEFLADIIVKCSPGWSESIEVRTHSSKFLMHHKFAIIDKEIVITGTLNWTLKTLTHNHKNVVITNEENITKAYINEFERLWNTLKNVKFL
ncbi:mitochondrial cardiolipin hydrolase-like [Centruroides vittatus]|uniref:mitochondrial cardiolipin hydrolase-like n=1 Tax=Centruroides vittatus TaxID=120091 RepID=UPI00350E969E